MLALLASDVDQGISASGQRDNTLGQQFNEWVRLSRLFGAFQRLLWLLNSSLRVQSDPNF